MKRNVLNFHGDVVTFTLEAGAGGAPGAVVERPVQPGRLYELRCDAAVRVVAGKRKKATREDVEVQPTTPATFRARNATVSLAASTSAAFAWLVPVDETEK